MRKLPPAGAAGAVGATGAAGVTSTVGAGVFGNWTGSKVGAGRFS